MLHECLKTVLLLHLRRHLMLKIARPWSRNSLKNLWLTQAARDSSGTRYNVLISRKIWRCNFWSRATPGNCFSRLSPPALFMSRPLLFSPTRTTVLLQFCCFLLLVWAFFFSLRRWSFLWNLQFIGIRTLLAFALTPKEINNPLILI